MVTQCPRSCIKTFLSLIVYFPHQVRINISPVKGIGWPFEKNVDSSEKQGIVLLELEDRKDEYYEQIEDAPMGSPLSRLIANTYLEAFETAALASARLKRKCWTI